MTTFFFCYTDLNNPSNTQGWGGDVVLHEINHEHLKMVGFEIFKISTLTLLMSYGLLLYK